MLETVINQQNENMFLSFYENQLLVGKCHLTNQDGEGIDEYLFIQHIKSETKGMGYGRKMLQTLATLGVKSIDGGAFEPEEQSFWKHVGARFVTDTYFELVLEKV